MAENRNLAGHTAETGPSPCQEQKPAGEAEPSLGNRLATVQVARHSHDDVFLKTRTIHDADAAALQKARFASAGTRALGIRTLSSFRVAFRRHSSDPSHCDFRSLRVPPAWKVPH